MQKNYKEALIEKSNDYLLEMCLITYEDYEAEAIEVAKHILKERNINLNAMMKDETLISKLTTKQEKVKDEESRKGNYTLAILLIAGGIILAYFSNKSGIRLGFVSLAIILVGIYLIPWKWTKSKNDKN